MGCPVPGCSTGAAGVLRSAWMLYHLVGMSFSASTILTSRLSLPMTASFGEGLTIPKRDAPCQPSGDYNDGVIESFLTADGLLALTTLSAMEIGRASCRERV